jgi:hypothetical protein
MGKSTTGVAGWLRPHPWSAILLIAVVSTIAGCGGGGGDGGTSSASTSATLGWDASPSPEVVGYRLYVGLAPGTYLQPLGQGIDVGNVTTYTVTGLAGGRTYHFAATTHDALGNESAYSNEVSKAIP